MSVRLGRRAAALGVAAVVAAGTGALSRLPFSIESSERAAVRLSWRAPVARVEECRLRTDEELARLPVHMREPRICAGRSLPYVLQVAIDGRPLPTDTVHPSGARSDRPAYVLREIAVAPGWRRLAVSFRPTEESENGIEGRRPGRDRSLGGRRPALRARLDTTLVVAPGQVVLVTADEDGGSLRVRTRAGSP